MRSDFDAATVRFAEEIGETGAVSVEGGRTRWSVGGDLDARARTMRAPTGVLVHRPEEMTVDVRAGTSVADCTRAWPKPASAPRCRTGAARSAAP